MIKVLLTIFITIILIKSFLFDAYYVASESMKDSLLAGDYVIGNKSAYKLSTPKYIPFTNIEIPSIDIFELNEPQRNDIIVFKLDDFLVGEDYSNKDFIKRIVGKPGEKLHLKSDSLFIDDKFIKKFSVKNYNPNKSTEIEVKSPSEEKFYYMNFGPILIPKKGDTININPKNIKFWQPLINYENQGKFISVEGTVITFKGEPIKQYVIKENYYFVLGDNIYQSVDSRILGFVPESLIESKLVMIYLSILPKGESPTKNFFERIRFNRMFKFLTKK